MKAIFWGYKFTDMRDSWRQQTLWVAESLRREGFEIIQHPTFRCKGFEAKEYDPETDNPCDVVIYNHCDMSHIKGNVIKAERTWFMKPTVPNEIYTSLDTLGFGAYSTICYKEPDFNQIPIEEVKELFDTKVKEWINSRVTKWKSFENKECTIKEKDYHLILGQCGGDEATIRHDFGSHFTKLWQITRELGRVGDLKIIVKLHPYTDGINAPSDFISQSLKKKFDSLPNVTTYIGKLNIHNFIKGARCVLLANSGAGYETMMHHKPIIAWGHPEYHWIAYDLRHLADIDRAINLDWFDKLNQDKFLYWYLEKYCFHDQETSNKRVKDLLNERC